MLQRPRRAQHPGVQQEQGQDLGLRALPGAAGGQGLLPDQLQRQSQAAHCVVSLDLYFPRYNRVSTDTQIHTMSYKVVHFRLFL